MTNMPGDDNKFNLDNIPSSENVQLNLDQAQQETTNTIKTGAMLVSAANGLSAISDTLKQAIIQKTSTAPLEPIVPQEVTPVVQPPGASSVAPSTVSASLETSTETPQASPSQIAQNIQAAFSDLTQLVALQGNLAKILQDAKNNNGVLTSAQQESLNAIQTNIASLDAQIKATVSDLPPGPKSAVEALINSVPPSTANLSEWQSYSTQLESQISTLGNTISGIQSSVAIGATFSGLSALVSDQTSLEKFMLDVKNQSTLTPQQLETLEGFQSSIRNLYAQLNVDLNQLPGKSSLATQLQKLLSQISPPTGNDLSAWQTYTGSFNTTGVNSTLSSLKELANKEGVELKDSLDAAKLTKMLPGAETPGNGLAGNIAYWILGQVMTEIYSKVEKFQNQVSQGRDFLNIFGPMQSLEEAWSSKLENVHLPPTPRDKHLSAWNSFLKNVVAKITPNAFSQWKFQMNAYINKLKGIANNPPNQKLISMLSGISKKFNAEKATLSNFMSARGSNQTDLMKFFFTIKKTVDGSITFTAIGNNLKSGVRNKMLSFLSKVNGFGKEIKDDAASVESLNVTAQSNLQLQLNFLQEFMQTGPTLIQSLNELARAITANMKGT